MHAIADSLSSIPFLKEVAFSEIEATARYWRPARLSETERLWQQDTPAYELAVLLSGALEVCYDGVEVGHIRPGELVGEVSAFLLDGRRSATVTALEDSRLLKLPSSALRTLRREGSVVYPVLLYQALLVLARRIRRADRRIAQLTSGTTSAPRRAKPSTLKRWWRSLRSSGPKVPCPPLENVLRRQPGLLEASDEAIATIAAAFEAQPVEENEVIFLEGEEGAAGYIVAAGRVDVLRHVRGARAERLATLRPEDQFGMNTLVEKGTRTASCVAGAPGWVYRMDAESFKQLRGEARILWHENVLISLATQIRNANAALRRVKQSLPSRHEAPTPAPTTPEPTEPPASPSQEDAFKALLRASGFIESLPVSEAKLEKVRVVSTEDQKRSPHLKKK